MRGDDRPCNEQAQPDALRPVLGTAAGERFENRWHQAWRNRRASVVDGETHRITFVVHGDGYRSSSAVLDRISDEIRHYLREPLNVPLSGEIPIGLQTQHRVRMRGARFEHD